jgi:hypothetical protein
MIGAQDFIGFFDWTFEYLRRHFGEAGVTEFFEDTLVHKLNVDALILFKEKGLEGMAEYWGYAFGVGPKTKLTDKFFRFEMHDCPSRGYLIEKGQEAYHDFCEHCMGWITSITIVGNAGGRYAPPTANASLPAHRQSVGPMTSVCRKAGSEVIITAGSTARR